MPKRLNEFLVPELRINFSVLDLGKWVVRVKEVESIEISGVSDLASDSVFNKIVTNIIANRVNNQTKSILEERSPDTFKINGVNRADANAFKNLIKENLEYLPFAWAIEIKDRERNVRPTVQALEKAINNFHEDARE